MGANVKGEGGGVNLGREKGSIGIYVTMAMEKWGEASIHERPREC